jgi:nucleoside-triphosphatase THEP1
MNSKHILLEGIPGSGKTTFAGKIADFYKHHGVTVNLYAESQSHPADLGWNACVPFADYNNILQRYESLRGKIERNAVFENNTAIIAYTLID